MGVPPQLALLLIDLDKDTIPEDDEVVAGWGAFAIFIGLALVVAFLGWSLSRQIKKVRKAREEGVFGEDAIPRDDVSDEPDPEPDESDQSDQPDQTGER